MSMRSISHQLMPPQLEAFGLIPTLEAVASQINKSGTLHVQLCTPVSLTSIPWETSLALYRILMELINNTIKHSGATQACIKIDEYDSCLDCNYTDNGKGIAPECKGLGLGHKSIDGRVLAAQGTFKFCSPDEGGFWASVHIPIGKQKSF
jgi:signal transduction histidine kinase